jgi:hypothetical protein
MLALVLTLVLLALGSLVAALATSDMEWAWVSVAISALAAVTLFVDWIRHRRTTRSGATDTDAVDEEDEPEDGDDAGDDLDDEFAERAEERTAEVRRLAEDDDGDFGDEPEDEADREPAEEATDAADLLVVADLSVEVRVVDERPRYHLASCRWLGAKPTLGLPVAEARELGFTPCASCGPDGKLAAEHRAGREATREVHRR